MVCDCKFDKQVIGWLCDSQTDKQSPHPDPLRIAGGWVRCNQLGEGNCHDFDVVLTTCTAAAYASHFQNFVGALHPHDPRPHVKFLMPQSAKYRSLKIAKVHIRNLNVSFDFTLLRDADEMGDEIDMAMGENIGAEALLEGDARRRDFTVNALYYNLATKSVEDPLGVGLDHLNQRLLVCCVPGTKTFSDDPIRVLRAARFMSGTTCFNLCEDARKSAASEGVLTALVNDTPNDRFRSEIIRLLKLPNYEIGLQFLQTLPGVLQRASALMDGASTKEWYRRQQIDVFVRNYFDDVPEI